MSLGRAFALEEIFLTGTLFWQRSDDLHSGFVKPKRVQGFFVGNGDLYKMGPAMLEHSGAIRGRSAPTERRSDSSKLACACERASEPLGAAPGCRQEATGIERVGYVLSLTVPESGCLGVR